MAGEKKLALPEDERKEIEQAWQDSKSLPDEDRIYVQSELKAMMGELLEKYDAPIDKSKSPLNVIAEKGLEGLDYTSGLVRAVPTAGMIAAGEGPAAGLEALKDAVIPFEGRPAPSFIEATEAAGIPEGPSTELPKLGKVTTRGTLSLLADALSSPNALRAGLAKLLAKRNATVTAEQLGKILSTQKPQSTLAKIGEFLSDPAAVGPRKMGESVYESVFATADDASMAAGQGRLSDVAARHWVAGTPRGIRDRLSGLARSNDDAVQDILAESVRELPADLNVSSKKLLARAKNKLQEKSMEPGAMQEAADAMQAIDEKFAPLAEKTTVVRSPEGWIRTVTKPEDTLNIGELMATKKNFQFHARESGGYSTSPPNPNVKPNVSSQNKMEGALLSRGYSDVAHTARRAVEDLADQYKPGLGGEIFGLNRETAAILSAEKQLAELAKTSPWAFRSTIPGAIGFGSAYGLSRAMNVDPITALAIGTGAAMATGTTGRSMLGFGLKKFGPAAGSLGRAALVENYGPGMREISPWSLLEGTTE